MYNKLDRFRNRSRLAQNRMTSMYRVPKKFRFMGQLMLIGVIGQKKYEKPYLSKEVFKLREAMFWVPNVHGNLLGGVLVIENMVDYWLCVKEKM